MIINLTIEAFADGYESELDQLDGILALFDEMNSTAISLTVLDHTVVNVDATCERVKATAPNLFEVLKGFYNDSGANPHRMELRFFQCLHTVPTQTLLDIEHFLKDMQPHDLENLKDVYDDKILDNYDDLDTIEELQNIIDRLE